MNNPRPFVPYTGGEKLRLDELKKSSGKGDIEATNRRRRIEQLTEKIDDFEL